MKEFFKFMFASMAGFFIMAIILFFVFIGIISSIVAGFEKGRIDVPENTVLCIKLDNEIHDRAPLDPFENFDFEKMEPKKSLGLNVILKNLDKASRDEDIKGIYLNLSVIPAGMATVEEIRNALLKFKESGKFIIAYSEDFTQKAYYLATVADKIYLNPEGMFMFRGISAELVFFKETLEKLDAKMQIIRHGKYKSAVEPFMLDKMSKENREQMMALVDGIWNRMLDGISETRNISKEELNRIADKLLIKTTKDAVDYHFIDKTVYKDEILAELRNLLGIEQDDEISSLCLCEYTNAPDPEKKRPDRKNKIAVIYALGSIQGGEGGDLVIGSEKLSKAIRKARTDKKVKAIVMRVNSPGGSALASEVILREIQLAKKEKPVIVSMGNVAASGGYYIACAADIIFADPSTITGSIGVLGLIPNLEETMKNKLGMTFDYASTNENSDFLTTVFRPLTPYQVEVLTGYVEDIYDTFVNHVAKGRDMTFKEVDSIGQGRVWIGTDAVKIGLVDKFGGLTKAIELAAEMAEVESYRIVELPKQKDPIQELLKELFGGSSVQTMLKKELGANYKYFQYLKYLQEAKGVQARMPFDIYVN